MVIDEEGNKRDRSCLVLVLRSERSSPSNWLSPKAMIWLVEKLLSIILPPNLSVDICVFSLEK